MEKTKIQSKIKDQNKTVAKKEIVSKVETLSNRLIKTVIKRNGQKEDFDPIEITNRNRDLASDLKIDTDELTKNTLKFLVDEVSTSQIDEFSAETAFYMSLYDTDYDILSSRIFVTNLHKNTKDLLHTWKDLMNNRNKKLGVDQPIIRKDFFDFLMKNSDLLESHIDYSKDFNYGYFALSSLQSQSLKVGNKPVERPQHINMRVAIFTHSAYTDIYGNIVEDYNIEKIIDTYNALKEGKYAPASPIAFNSCAVYCQGSSCYLYSLQDNLLDIQTKTAEIGQASKGGGGNGGNIHKIRSKGSPILSTNGKSDGIIPMIKVYDSNIRYSNQCFTPETLIYTKTGYHSISDIIVGDQVINHNGKFNKVVKIFKREINEKILIITTKYSAKPLRCTKWHQIGYFSKKGLEFKSAEDLVIGDILHTPIPEFREDIKQDCDFLRFYALMFAYSVNSNNKISIKVPDVEGSTTSKFIKDYMKKGSFDSESNVFTFTEEDIKDVFGTFSLAEFEPCLYWVPSNKIMALLLGFFECVVYEEDEYLYYDWPEFRIVLIIRYLLLNVGVQSAITRFLRDGHSWYRLKFIKTRRLCNLFGMIYTGTYFFDRNSILDIEEVHYRGYVYDLHIENIHNYMTDIGIVHNSGKRKGTNSFNLEPWHPEIMEYLELPLKDGAAAELRALDTFVGVWMPDLIMIRVAMEGKISLFDPYVILKRFGKQFDDAYGEEFEKMYLKAEEEKLYEKQIDARKLFDKICDVQGKAGIPYMMYKDMINYVNNQGNLGTIKGSNLCCEIVEHTGPKDAELMKLHDLKRFYLTDLHVPHNSMNALEFKKRAVNRYYEEVKNRLENIPKDTKYTLNVYQPSTLFSDTSLISKNIPFTTLPENRIEGIFLDINDIPFNKTDLILYDEDDDFAVCTLSSIALPKFVKDVATKTIDWKELARITEMVTENLDNIIDRNDYPTLKTRRTALEQRAIGIGFQGLSDLFMIFEYPWEENEALELSRVLHEVKYYYSLKKSCELARLKGAYPYFKGSHLSIGLLQCDVWKEIPFTDSTRSQKYKSWMPKLDWDWLRQQAKLGVRNSLRCAQMPTASSSIILGNYEALEMQNSNIYVRKVLTGEYLVVNKHLTKYLKDNRLFSKNIIQRIIKDNGSVQKITEISEKIRKVYKTVWEISQKRVTEHAALIQPFLDQMHSKNMFIQDPTYAKLTTMHFDAWAGGLARFQGRLSDEVKAKIAKNIKFAPALVSNYYIRSKPLFSAESYVLTGEEISQKTVCTEDVCVMCQS